MMSRDINHEIAKKIIDIDMSTLRSAIDRCVETQKYDYLEKIVPEILYCGSHIFYAVQNFRKAIDHCREARKIDRINDVLSKGDAIKFAVSEMKELVSEKYSKLHHSPH